MRLFALFLLLLLVGCYSMKKATNQVRKANDNYPEMVAKFLQKEYPCIDKKSDTTFIYDTTYQSKIDTFIIENPILSVDTIIKKDTIFRQSKERIVTITKTIIQKIEDSSKLTIAANQLSIANKKLDKFIGKSEQKSEWIKWLLIILCISIIFNILLIKK